ncbi:MAG: outer membrane lipoprotein carrier protein LolA [Bacteroidetes bacterium]|nr:outer membrane lipoprotein carrier protein LolA [Bacteroidota bacterium]
MKKLSIIESFFLIFYFCGFSLFAQDNSNAIKILDAVSAKMKAYTSMKIEFTYTMANAKTKVNESKIGTIQVKGAKYRVEVGGQIIFCDGKTVWTYLKDEKEVNVNNVSGQEDAIPTTILNNYSKNYKPKFIKDAVEGGKTISIIDLTPLKTKSYYKVRIYIDKTSQQVTNTIIYDKNGSTYTYKVNKFTTNLVLAETIFSFSKTDYPGVEVNDMR